MNYLVNLCWCSFQLQDLATSPGIRNPELNNAECVIEGHGTDIQATGRSLEIRIMIWGSFCFTCAVFSPLLQMTIGFVFLLNLSNSSAYKAALCLSFLAGILGSLIWVILLSSVIYFMVRDGPVFYVDILLILIPFLYFITPLSKRVRDIWNNYNSPDPAQRRSGFMWFKNLLAPVSVVFISFCFCWMLIGIMLNPIWGLTVALAICLVVTFFIYVVDSYVGVRQFEFAVGMHSYLQRMWILSFLGLTFLILVAIIAGQAFNARETAGDILKTALLTALASLTSWLSWKKLAGQEPERRGNPVGPVGEPYPEPAEFFFIQQFVQVGRPNPDPDRVPLQPLPPPDPVGEPYPLSDHDSDEENREQSQPSSSDSSNHQVQPSNSSKTAQVTIHTCE